jgi:hypothetical protein
MTIESGARSFMQKIKDNLPFSIVPIESSGENTELVASVVEALGPRYLQTTVEIVKMEHVINLDGTSAGLTTETNPSATNGGVLLKGDGLLLLIIQPSDDAPTSTDSVNGNAGIYIAPAALELSRPRIFMRNIFEIRV